MRVPDLLLNTLKNDLEMRSFFVPTSWWSHRESNPEQKDAKSSIETTSSPTWPIGIYISSIQTLNFC